MRLFVTIDARVTYLQRYSQSRWIVCHRQEPPLEAILPFTAHGIFPILYGTVGNHEVVGLMYSTVDSHVILLSTSYLYQ